MPKTIVLNVIVTPNAPRSEVVSREGNTWRVRVAAKPADGAANAALIELVAETLGIPKSLIEITRGLRSRRKRLTVVLPGWWQEASI